MEAFHYTEALIGTIAEGAPQRQFPWSRIEIGKNTDNVPFEIVDNYKGRHSQYRQGLFLLLSD